MPICLHPLRSGRFSILFLFVWSTFFCNSSSAQIELDFNQVTLCEGDSFDFSNFIQNHVKVPVDYQLLGWEEGWLGKVSLRTSTKYHLLFARKDGVGGVQKSSFQVDIIPAPNVELAYNHVSICEGGEVVVPPIHSYSCDKVYWENLADGKRYAIDENLVCESEEECRYLIVATNESCAMMSSELLVCDIVKPSDYRFVLRRNWSEQTIDFMVDIFYKGNYVKTVKQTELDNDFQILEVQMDSSLSLYHEIRVQLIENQCGNIYSPSWKIPMSREVNTEVKEQLKVSYHCQSLSGIGELCIGSFFPIEEVILRNIHHNQFSSSIEDWREDYNHETYFYPYHYALPICGKVFKSDRDTFLLSIFSKDDLGNDFLFSDTLIVDRCRSKSSETELICKNEQEEIWVEHFSVDSVVNYEFNLDGQVICPKFFFHKTTSGSLPYWSRWGFDQPLSGDGKLMKLLVNYEGCASYSDSFNVNFAPCLSPPRRIYFGAYSSPSSILLKKNECLTFQCSSVEGEVSDTLFVDFPCPDVELFLKFRWGDEVGEKNKDLSLIFDQNLDFDVIYPFEFIKEERVVIWNAGLTKDATIQLFELPEDGIISGRFNEIPFVYKINKPLDFLVDSLKICYGDTLDLGVYLFDSTLRWNVDTLQLVPKSSKDYYLYGITRHGCVVDESLHVSVLPPLWWDVRDTFLCKGQFLWYDDFLHSNATSIYLGGTLMVDLGWIVDKDSLFNFQLVSLCDTQNIDIQVDVKECDFDYELENELVYSVEDLLLMTRRHTHFILSIYDRNGRLLSQFKNEFLGWDGRYKGERVPTDSYWFELFISEENRFCVGCFLWENR